MSYQCCDTDLDPWSRLPPKFNHLFIDNLPWKFHASRFEIFCAKLLRGRLTDKQTTTKTYPPWLGGCKNYSSYHLQFLFNQYSFPKLMQVRPVPWSKPLQFLVYILQAWYLPVSHPTNCSKALKGHSTNHHHTTPPPQPFYGPFSGTTPGEPVPEENFWTWWCKGTLTEADTPTIRLGATPSGLAGAHLHHPPIFFTGRMPFLPPNQQCQSTEGNNSTNFNQEKSSTGLSLSWTTNRLLRERDTSTPGVALAWNL